MVHFIQQYSRKEIFTIMQFKKQPISTIGAIKPCVNSTVEHEHLIQFPCETWQSAGTCHHQ